ncbi:MAG: orotidine-5'-phosphate decarboxylase [Candidatus Brocadiia bacterium]
MAHFADRLADAVDAKGNPCSVGLDPRLELIPGPLRDEVLGGGGWTREGAARLVERFCREAVDIVAPRVPAVKVQSAFFECLGAPGVAAFEQTVRYARSQGLVVIADVKRSDIGSTAEAYARGTVGAVTVGESAVFELGADACTVNPYFGWDGVEPFVREAARRDRGVFVLVRTSNPTADDVQGLACKGVPVFMRVGALVHRWGREHVGRRGYSCVGAVVAGNLPVDAEKLRRLMPHAYFLVPGYGAQGGGAADVARTFDARGYGALINSSRGILFAHTRSPFDRQFGEARWREAVAAATDAMVAELRRL